MATKRKQNKITENKGLNKIREIINEKNCIFNEIDTGNDIGIDAYIEIIENEEATGCCIATQIKSGDSFLHSNKMEFIIQSDKDHFEYWDSHMLPVVILGYIPNKNKIVWFDVTKYLKDNPSKIKNGPYTIKISIHNELNIETFNDFKNYFYRFYSIDPNEKNYIASQNILINFQNEKDERIISSFKLLFYFFRNNKSLWYFLINLFTEIDDKMMEYNILYFLRHIVSHGDIFWNKWNIIDREITDYARNYLSRRFRKKEIIKLLSLIDDEGIQRGQVGQDVDAVLRAISDIEKLLELITFDFDIEIEIRYWSLILLVSYVEYRDKDEAKVFLKRFLSSNRECENYDILSDIYENFNDFGLPLY